MLAPHCGICGVPHAGGWADADAHLQLRHPEEWAHILATGGVEGDCMGCRCGYTSYAQGRSEGAWDRGNARRHRLQHSTEGVAALLKSAATHVCNIDGCTKAYRDYYQLTAHQESTAHLAVRYYCPLTAEHCSRAPCAYSLSNSETSGPTQWIIGRNALDQHLRQYHAGHRGREAGLNLSWPDLLEYRFKS